MSSLIFPIPTLDDLAPRLSKQNSRIRINKYVQLLLTIILYIYSKSLLGNTDLSLVSSFGRGTNEYFPLLKCVGFFVHRRQ